MALLQYDISGRLDRTARTIVLSSGLGGLAGFWAPQLDALGERYRVITYDHRGTGRNREDLHGDHAIADMADDVLAILADAGVERCHFVGHALGALIGLQIALAQPEVLDRLVVVNGWSCVDRHTAKCFAIRKEILVCAGAKLYLAAQPLFLYPAAWLSAHAEAFEREEGQALEHFPGVANTLTRIAALLAFDVHERLSDIVTPTLVVASLDDLLVPSTRSEDLAARLADSRLTLVQDGGHAFTAVRPALFNEILIDFLANGAIQSGPCSS